MEGGTEAVGVQEYVAEEAIWPQDAGNRRKLCNDLHSVYCPLCILVIK